MISCILWESHKLKSFSAWNQFKAARFVTNYGKSWFGTTQTINFGPYICDQCLWIDALLHSLWMTNIFRKSQIEALWCPESVQSSAICDRFVYGKIVVGDHLDHQFWTPYMWSMSLDRCSPAFSVNDKHFQKVTNWSALVPGISSEQRDLWPFRLLDLVWMQWN